MYEIECFCVNNTWIKTHLMLSHQIRTYINFTFLTAHLLTQHFSRSLYPSSSKSNKQICGEITVMTITYSISTTCVFLQGTCISLLYFIVYNFTEIQYNNTHTFIGVSCTAFSQYEPSLYFNSALVSGSALDQLIYPLSACVTGKPHYPISIRKDVLRCGFSASNIVCHLTAQMLTADQNDKS